MLEVEKGRIYAEAEKKFVEEKLREFQSTTKDQLKEAEVHKQLLEKKAQSYKDDADDPRWQKEQEIWRLSADNDCLRSQLKTTEDRVQELEGEIAVLETRVANLLVEIKTSRKKREGEEAASHECKLSDAMRQQQPVEEEFNTVTNLL